MILKFRKREKRTLSQRHFIFRGHFCIIFLAVAPLDLQIDPYLPGRLGLQTQIVGRLGARRHRQFIFMVRNDLRKDLRLRPSISECHFDALLVVLLVRRELVLDRELRVERLLNYETRFLAVQDDEKGPCRVE